MEQTEPELSRKEDRRGSDDEKDGKDGPEFFSTNETADKLESTYEQPELSKDHSTIIKDELSGQGSSVRQEVKLDEHPTQPLAIEAILVGSNARKDYPSDISQISTHKLPIWREILSSDVWTPNREQASGNSIEHSADRTVSKSENRLPLLERPTIPLPAVSPVRQQEFRLTRGWATFLAVLLMIVIINATIGGFSQFFGSSGWGSVFNNVGNSDGSNLLNKVNHQLNQTPVPGGTGTATPSTPLQTVNYLLANMTLAEKLGQMMMVQFTGPDYSLALSTMLTQYKVGSALVFSANGNIVSKTQLKNLIVQMQQNAFLPLAVSIDQEGGQVDRLVNLDGPQPSAASIGASGDPNRAYQQGLKDAQDLSSYGFNLNLAPVVDVTNVYNAQLYERTYGTNAAIVTHMAQAYLRGLQQSGHVLGTLKHFPGLGDVSVDPHYRPPDLTRSLADLNSIDWSPYRQLIAQGHIHAIMVTHEYVQAVDTSNPSSLSAPVISILRNQMHFQGVIMTDSLTMDSIHNYYTYGKAAAMAVEAGDDMLMGAESPNDVAQMLDGIRQAIDAGDIKSSQIDDSVRRILLLKYEMGLIHVSK